LLDHRVMSKLLALASSLLIATACGGKSSATAVPPVPTVSDGGTPLPPPDGMSGNPSAPDTTRSNQQ
jgi:hypothetical protein